MRRRKGFVAEILREEGKGREEDELKELME